MDSRPRETDSATDPLTTLPPELQLAIFNLATLESLGRMQQTSHYYNNLLMDNYFWDNKQSEQLTPTPFIIDNKNQYHAELLYQEVMTTPDADQKQISALKLRRFLQQQLKPWTHYYRGLSFFSGMGVKANRTVGFQHLLDALDNEDYRAAIVIAKLLVESKTDDPELFQQLTSLLDAPRQHLLLQSILNVHEKRITLVAKLLGKLYAHGITVEANFAIAEKYYLDNMTHVCDDLSELARLKFDSLPTNLDLEKKTLATISYIKTFLNKLPDPATQSVLHYWSAFLAFIQGNNQAAITLLENASELACTKIFLSHLLADANLPQVGVLRLIELTNTKEDIAGDLFDLQMQFSTISDSVMRTRHLTHCSMIKLAEKVSKIYRQEISMDILANDCYMVWWLQLAAQSGCTESLNALLAVDAKQYPYVCYALAVIHEFGILHSETIEPNHDQAEKYFHLARNNKLDDYIQTGVDNEFGCPEVMRLLTRATTPNSSYSTCLQTGL